MKQSLLTLALVSLTGLSAIASSGPGQIGGGTVGSYKLSCDINSNTGPVAHKDITFTTASLEKGSLNEVVYKDVSTDVEILINIAATPDKNLITLAPMVSSDKSAFISEMKEVDLNEGGSINFVLFDRNSRGLSTVCSID